MKYYCNGNMCNTQAFGIAEEDPIFDLSRKHELLDNISQSICQSISEQIKINLF